jgi:hypothetical protein
MPSVSRRRAGPLGAIPWGGDIALLCRRARSAIPHSICQHRASFLVWLGVCCLSGTPTRTTRTARVRVVKWMACTPGPVDGSHARARLLRSGAALGASLIHVWLNDTLGTRFRSWKRPTATARRGGAIGRHRAHVALGTPSATTVFKLRRPLFPFHFRLRSEFWDTGTRKLQDPRTTAPEVRG